ncbi:hypothetical protein [Vulcaniibacterium tengchongense]|uniref:Uncharacterized protein n=1 Tax=Vulcaniibacterium tengchongense TaxID=1273429 RepID=A0A3N4VC39_9GAMM|nr:hypothetical protein [Vulcaniibacterium tengchongense]RPE77241.1 hypothetical protein EDC50_2507 [Vulcaniibacterium tengchongense]
MNRSASFVLLSLALAAAPAAAQGTRPPTLGNPSPVPTLSPPPSSGVVTRDPTGRSPNQLGRQLESASRRVQADGIGNQIRQREAQIQADSLRIEQQRAVRDPAESELLRVQDQQRRQDYQRWRDQKQRERQRLESEPPPAADER